MESEIYHRTGGGADQAPRIEMMRVEHSVFDKQNQGLDASNGSWVQDAFGMFKSCTDVANTLEVMLITTSLGECGARDSQYHSQHPVIYGLSLARLASIHVVYGSVKACFVEDWYELEEVVEVVLHKLSGNIVWWQSFVGALGKRILGASRKNQTGI